MQERFISLKNKKLQNAYGIWASKISNQKIVAICLNDPDHQIAAFFGISLVGKQVCIASSDIVKNLDKRFIILNKKITPSNHVATIKPQNNFITFSGGSTKKPKAILRTHKSWIYSFKRNGVLKSDKVAVLGHLSHSLALYAATEAMHIGAKLIFLGMRPQGKPTILYATPTLLKLVYKSDKIYSQVRTIFIGGGHFSDDDKTFCKYRFPNAEIKVFYGTAETSFITISDSKTPPNSVGQTYDGVEIYIKEGAISVKTPMLATNYLDNQIVMDPNLPFSTGEIGWIDDNNFLFLKGRSDRAVNISDKLIHLDALEEDLISLPGIEHAAVITLPDKKRGQKAFAAVCGCHITHPQISGIICLEEWPILLSGKTDYFKVKEILQKAFL